MSWSPHVTVAAVIRRDDRYLMVEESPHGEPVINQPAGHLEFGETLLEAVIREVLEETCRDFTPTGLIGIYQWALPDSKKTYLRFCFCGEVGETLPDCTRDPDIAANHWLTLKQISSDTFTTRSPLVLRCIDDANRSEPLGLEILHAIA